MLKGTSGPQRGCQELKERLWVFKVDRWTYFKGAYSGPSSCVAHLSLAFAIFSVRVMNWNQEKGFFFSVGLQWEMIRDYYRMKINDKVWALYEEEKQQEQEEHVPNYKAKGKASPHQFSGNDSVPYIDDLHKLMTLVINRPRCIYYTLWVKVALIMHPL